MLSLVCLNLFVSLIILYIVAVVISQTKYVPITQHSLMRTYYSSTSFDPEYCIKTSSQRKQKDCNIPMLRFSKTSLRTRERRFSKYKKV